MTYDWRRDAQSSGRYEAVNRGVQDLCRTVVQSAACCCARSGFAAFGVLPAALASGLLAPLVAVRDATRVVVGA